MWGWCRSCFHVTDRCLKRIPKWIEQKFQSNLVGLKRGLEGWGREEKGWNVIKYHVSIISRELIFKLNVFTFSWEIYSAGLRILSLLELFMSKKREFIETPNLVSTPMRKVLAVKIFGSKFFDLPACAIKAYDSNKKQLNLISDDQFLMVYFVYVFVVVVVLRDLYSRFLSFRLQSSQSYIRNQ